MLIGIVGKPSCGKSTFFKAATLAEAEIANYPFTTIKPNHGMGYVKVECVESEVAKSDLVGSSMVLTNHGFTVNPLVSEEEFSFIGKKTGLCGTTATANYGDKFIGNSVIANSKVALAGLHTSGHELMRIDEGLTGR